MPELVTAIAVVLLTSFCCSLCEAVLYSVPASHIERLIDEGRGSGRILQRLRAQIDRPIAAILILNTVANTGGAAVAGALADHALGTRYMVYFTTGLTLAILVFGEMLPKTAGVVYWRTLAALVARPIQAMVLLLTPAIWVSRGLTHLLTRGRSDTPVTDEDLMVLVRLGIRSGHFKEHEARVIKNILALEGRTVRDVMTPRTVLFTLQAQATVGEIRDEPALQNYSRFPVYGKDSDDIVGIVHGHDVLTAIGADRFDQRLEELMAPVDFVLESTSLDVLLTRILGRRRHMVVAIDEYGGLAGVVTLEDVLEEILGKEIVDEFDQVSDLREVARMRREVALGRKRSPAPKGSPPGSDPAGGGSS
jgi:CBS domain containing-hemolysin-like protein